MNWNPNLNSALIRVLNSSFILTVCYQFWELNCGKKGELESSLYYKSRQVDKNSNLIRLICSHFRTSHLFKFCLLGNESPMRHVVLQRVSNQMCQSPMGLWYVSERSPVIIIFSWTHYQMTSNWCFKPIFYWFFYLINHHK